MRMPCEHLRVLARGNVSGRVQLPARAKWRARHRFETCRTCLQAQRDSSRLVAVREGSTLTWQEARYTQQLLSECRPEHLTGLVDLLRFGIAAEDAAGPSVAAAWLLNAARFTGLPSLPRYRRKDGSAFPHCDGEWVEAKVAPEGSFSEQLSAALHGVGAEPRVARFNRVGLASVLERKAPAVLVADDALRLILAYNAGRERAFVCEIEKHRARLKWCALEVLEATRPDLISLDRDERSEAARADRESRSEQVLSATSSKGLTLLPGAEGLWVLAYAALHGHTQSDLSSCQVASLSSVRLPKGIRARVVERASSRASGEPIGTQGALRAAAAQHLKEHKGLDFDFRGLSAEELYHVARELGLEAQLVTLKQATPEVVDRLRADARASLGRLIVNFFRPALGQPGGGHHAVVVAYHPARDLLLIDDPAGFKTPPYWVSPRKLAAAAATFDPTVGVARHRGYVIVEGEQGQRGETDLSASVLFGRSPV
jgi:hypothetical protein